MTNPFDDAEGEFLILVNHELQYSLWPSKLAVPPGWSTTGPRGNRQVCLEWIDKNWTDMRPCSLQREIEKHARQQDRRAGDGC